MFKDVKAFSSFSVEDIVKSKQFYREVLGLDVSEDPKMPGLLNVSLMGGGMIMIYPKGGQHVPASYTVLNFLVNDISDAVDKLTAAGVQFESYQDGPVKTDAKGIAWGKEGFGPSIAWFKDPSGNILAVIQESKRGLR
jgi:catechol 2,3-dioxygenase-like lactoylglutathione lyase family enzyme